MSIELRAREIAEFLGIPEADAIAKLSRGFGELHNEVTADFRRANPQTDEQLLEWYRTTEAYIWELTAYHLDPGFNYSGMCEGIAIRLKSEFPGGRVLCLGDGVGDLTLCLFASGISGLYHDLENSRIDQFAQFRFARNANISPDPLWFQSSIFRVMSSGWAFPLNCEKCFDAIVSLDFLEHSVDVSGYVKAIFSALKPGGLMMTQNAFGCGSGPDGSIPMHLTRNDCYVTEWDNLCSSVGFQQISSNWYERPR